MPMGSASFERDIILGIPAAAVHATLPQLVVHRSGWLEKEGAKGLLGKRGGKTFKRRYCVLLGSALGSFRCRYLVYYDSPDAPAAKGCVVLEEGGYSVSYPKKERRGHPFCIRIDVCHGDVSSPQQRPKWLAALH